MTKEQEAEFEKWFKDFHVHYEYDKYSYFFSKCGWKAAIEMMEKRRCKDCKNWDNEDYQNKDLGRCDLGIVECACCTPIFPKDYGCRYWELREEKII